jgi:hypothetical protein
MTDARNHDLEIPVWPEGTAAVLSTTTVDGAPHAIPVSTAVRTGDRTVHFALGSRRESLANLRADPRCALTVMAAGGLALTLHGRATEVDADAAGPLALRLDVDDVQDHMQPTFAIDAGVDWRWTDEDAAQRDGALRARLGAL